MNRYRVQVPVLIEIEVETTAKPERTLVDVMNLFDSNSDPLMGANLRTGARPFIAHVRGAVLYGRAYLVTEEDKA